MHAPDSSNNSTGNTFPRRHSEAGSTDGAVHSRGTEAGGTVGAVDSERKAVGSTDGAVDSEGKAAGSTDGAVHSRAAAGSTDGAVGTRGTATGSTDGAVHSRRTAGGSMGGAVDSRGGDEPLAEPEQAQEEGSESGGVGRPRGHAVQRVGEMMEVIRRLGISDSKAAEQVGVSTSTISRWKVEQPKLKRALGLAREEFRARQLETILRAAGAEQGRGWRAAAWLLERVFPADYARSAAERDRAEQREWRQGMREEAEEDVQRIVTQYTERVAAREAAESAGADEPSREVAKLEPAKAGLAEVPEAKPQSGARPQQASPSDLPGSASQYSQNPAVESAGEADAVAARLGRLIFPGGASQNSQSSTAGVTQGRASSDAKPGPAILQGSIFRPEPLEMAQAA